MMNLRQLSHMEDTLKRSDLRKKEFKDNFYPYFSFKRDLSKLVMPKKVVPVKSYLLTLPKDQRVNIVEIALNQAREGEAYINSSTEDIDVRQKLLNKDKVEWHQMDPVHSLPGTVLYRRPAGRYYPQRRSGNACGCKHSLFPVVSRVKHYRPQTLYRRHLAADRRHVDGTHAVVAHWYFPNLQSHYRLCLV